MIKKITIQILVISLLFVLAPKAMAGEPTAAQDVEFYSQVAESNLIFEYLTSTGVRVWEVNQLLDYLARMGYFEKSKPDKIKFLNKVFRQHRFLFSNDMPLVAQIESGNGWSMGSHTVDYYYSRCNTDGENLVATHAAIFFVNAYCYTGGSDFLSKDKWSAQDLDSLYNNYWRDLANQRYMPVFSQVEMGRLTVFGGVYRRLHPSGANCGQMNEQGLRDITFETALTIVGVEAVAVDGSAAIIPLLRDEAIVRTIDQIDNAVVQSEVRMFSGSGLPQERWAEQYDYMKGQFLEATTPGSLNPMAGAAARLYFQNNVVVIPRNGDQESPAKFDLAGNLTEPMKVNRQFGIWGRTLDGRSINGFYPASIRHAVIHSSEASQLAISAPNYANVLSNNGINSNPNLSSEMWSEFFAQYELGTIKSRDDIETLIASGNYAYLDNMLRYAGGVTARIQTSRGVSFDQAVRVAWDRYRGADGGLSAMYWDFMPHGVYRNA